MEDRERRRLKEFEKIKKDGTSTEFDRGVAKTKNKIIDLIKQDISYQETHLQYDYEKDKSIMWRIEGMNNLIKQIELFAFGWEE